MEQIEDDMILRCSGNGPSQYPGIPGVLWNQGGVDNVRFVAAPLSSIFEKSNVTVDRQVKYITAEGHDLPHGT
jgi:Oxidoreductase molybdopterin binding domain